MQLPTGAHPGNSGGKKGRSGRPPELFRQWARALYDDPKVRREIERVLRDSTSRHYAAVHRALLPYVEATRDAELAADHSCAEGKPINLGNLSDKELALLERLLRKASAGSASALGQKPVERLA